MNFIACNRFMKDKNSTVKYYALLSWYNTIQQKGLLFLNKTLII